MENKIALITGGGSGIGLEIAKEYKLNGYNCILVGRNKNNIIKAYEKIGEKETIDFGVCDVSKYDEVDELLSKIKDHNIEISVLINCAGTEGGGKTEDVDIADWERVIDTNLNSVFIFTKLALKKKMISKGGAIINIASTGGKQGVMFGAPYSASKHGVVGFTKSLGIELARRNSEITVNAICPGFVETEMAERVRKNYARLNNVSEESVKKDIEKRIPIGRYIEPSEVAKLAIFLSSDGARGITAQAINVCGGLGNY